MKSHHQNNNSDGPSTSPSSSSATCSYSTPNLKTNGFEESEYYHHYLKCHDHNYRDNKTYEERGSTISSEAIPIHKTVEDDDINDANTEYLPRTAALLLSVLLSARGNKKSDRSCSDDDAYNDDEVRFNGEEDNSLFENLLHPPSDDVALATAMDDVELPFTPRHQPHSTATTDTTTLWRSSTLDQMEANEIEADALFASIIHMDDGMYSQSFREEFAFPLAAPTTTAKASFLNNDNNYDDDDDDESIRGDVARLTRSIAYLQRDLERADFSFLDDLKDKEIVCADVVGENSFRDHGNGWNEQIERFKMWLLRNSITEQKLILSHNMIRGSLFWSVVLKVALFSLIMMRLNSSELLVEGGMFDQNLLAEIVEWLIG